MLFCGLVLVDSARCAGNPTSRVCPFKISKYLRDPVSIDTVASLSSFVSADHWFDASLDVYHLGLQAASALMTNIGNDVTNDEMDLEVKRSLHNILGPVVATGRDFDWIVQAILGSLCMQYVSLFCSFLLFINHSC